MLHGTWRGRGTGDFPTIEAFRYAEELRFEVDEPRGLLHYEQRTRLMPQDEASHCEVGYLRVLEGGELELSNAQESGRVEVLRGTATVGEDGLLRLDLASLELGHDPRLVRTRRVIEVRGDTLHYAAWMATWTTDTPALLPHLEAKLERV